MGALTTHLDLRHGDPGVPAGRDLARAGPVVVVLLVLVVRPAVVVVATALPVVPRIQALTEEIERTREDVGETVAALAAKADIMARARAKTSEIAGRLRDTAGKVKEQMADPEQHRVVLAVAAGVVLLAGALIARRHRR